MYVMEKRGLARYFLFAGRTAKSEPVDFNARTSDEDLMRAYQKGSDAAFGLLLSRHQRPVYNFVRKFFSNQEEAEEVFQETFLRIVKSAQDYCPDAKFTTWLYTVARNYCIDRYRKKKHRNEMSLDQPLGDENITLQDKLPADHVDIDESVSGAQLEAQLRKVLDEMNDDQKEVFILRHFQGMAFEDIAKVTGVSVNTVKSRMRYALKSIQKAFQLLGIDGVQDDGNERGSS